MERKDFRVICEATSNITIKGQSVHFSFDRKERFEAIERKIGSGDIVAEFVVDRSHKNGYERHIIHSNGVVLMVNEHTKRVITIIVARQPQITRYWEGLHRQIPSDLEYLLSVAKQNEMRGYNYL
jgi:hypothetical protein